MPHPDQKYIQALLSNNEAVLRELYAKYYYKVKRMVEQSSGSDHDAHDIFQEALLSIHDSARRRNFILTCPFESFFLLVCKNKWKNELSKRRTHPVTFMDTTVNDFVGDDCHKVAEEFMLQQEREKLILEKFAKLGVGCRQLLGLSLGGKPMEEVAKMLKISYGYARKKKSECMAKLIQLVRESARFTSLK